MQNRHHHDPVRLTIAQHTIRAARNRLNWGRHAARLYCIHRQVPLGLYRLACQLQAAQSVVDLMPAILRHQALRDYQAINAGGCISC